MKKLYGDEYVQSYKGKSPFRLRRLCKYMAVENTFRVADFGCGNGMLMELIAPKVKSYTGIDFSESFIEAANEKKKQLSIKNAHFVCADINEFCQNHLKAFDAGFAMDFSEHLDDEEWAQILLNIRRSIRPKGKLYIHTPNAYFFLEKMKSRNFIFKQLPGHVAVRTPEHNAFIIKAAGFDVKQQLLIGHYNMFKIIHPFSYIPVLGKYFQARIFIEAIA